ncbi:DUF4328 domain-containing protein [Gordonia phosphorivorans]|uniref:DUF4328 domain-containing protein n=1 Tax=Gordonia phosphorivorans TaxID=1056982 RepID=A0ABV6HBA5_9ACTN
MLDVCLRCQIQADHLPGRATCPRCGGNLVVLDAQTRRAVQVAAPAQAPPRPPAPMPPTPMPPTPMPGARRAAPARTPLRWVAHRPLNTLPPTRPPRAVRESRTPRYTYLPLWGLHDVVPAPESDAVAAPDPGRRLRWALQIVWPILAVAAGLQLLRYALLMLNRSHPIPYWLDLAVVWLLLFAGAAATGAAIWALVLFARWLVAARESAYAAVAARDPRRRWLVIAGAVTPFVNVVTAPFLLLEAAAAVGADQAQRVRPAINRVAVAWALVSGVGLIALGYRIAAWSSGSIQVGADAMMAALLTFVASALFAVWVRPRLAGLVVTDAAPAPQTRRLVVAA